MPRMNRLSSRLAADGQARQEQATRYANRAAGAVDARVGRWWKALCRALADPRGNWHTIMALLRSLPGVAAATTHEQLVRLARWARRSAAKQLVDVLPEAYLTAALSIYEDRSDRREIADLIFPAPPLERTEAWVADLLDRISFHGTYNGMSPEAMAEVVARGMAGGKTQREIAKDLLPLANDVRVSAMRTARTWGLYVASQESQAVHDELGDLVIGYQVHASLDRNTRPWHAKRDGQVYYLNPGPGQKGMEKCPHPPLEAADPSERPPDAPRIAWN